MTTAIAATANATTSAAPAAGAGEATTSAPTSRAEAMQAKLIELGHGVNGEGTQPNTDDTPDNAEATPEAKPEQPDEDHEVDAQTGEKKLGRIGKIKERFRAQLAEKEAHVAKLSEETGQWREASTKVLAQNRALAERNAWLEQMLEQHNVRIDPRDRELLDLRLQQQMQGLEQQMSQRNAEQREKASTDARVQTIASQMREQAETVAESHGLELPALVRAWNALSEAEGRTVPLDEVAQMLALSQRQRQEAPVRAAVARQTQKNATAPRTTSTAAAAPASVEWPRTEEGKLAFLRAQGHDL